MSEYCVYYLYGSDDDLLYIGYSRNVTDRIRNHRGKEWMSDFSYFKTRDCESREMALLFEEREIKLRYPKHNCQYKLGHPPTVEDKIEAIQEYELSMELHAKMKKIIDMKDAGYGVYSRKMPIAFVRQIEAFIKEKSQEWEEMNK